MEEVEFQEMYDYYLFHYKEFQEVYDHYLFHYMNH